MRSNRNSDVVAAEVVVVASASILPWHPGAM